MARSSGRRGAKDWIMVQRANEAHRWSAPFSRHPGWWVFLLALTVRLALILATGSYQRPERTEVVNIAIKLAHNGEFADPYGPGTGPNCHVVTSLSAPAEWSLPASWNGAGG